MKKLLILLAWGAIVVPIMVFSGYSTEASVPPLINYQGMLTESDGTTPVADDQYNLGFKIYGSQSGDDSLWWEYHLNVQVTNGLFNVILGSQSALNLPFDAEYWLETIVETEIMPTRLQFTSVGYAYRAKVADSAAVAGSGVSSVGWVDDGTVVRLESATDSVGIGTVAPGAKLHLVGGGFLINTAELGGYYARIDGNEITGGTAGGAPGSHDLHVKPGDNSSYLLLAEDGGNVGIGTADPAQDLDVVGTVQMTGFKMPTGASSGFVLTSDASGVGTWQAAAGGGADNDWTFRITDTADTTLITGSAWGIARYGNTLYGNADSTHVNLGVACTTGTSGQNYKYCTVSGGFGNTASYNYATVGGGYLNTASGNHAAVGGGRNNLVEGDYSAITGGYADTITSTADYSYLFGIGSKLTADSTFMVDMPYIRFGDETNGYEFPTSDGSNGQVMATNGSGQLSWTTVSGAGDNDWAFRITDTADTTLITGGAWGIARYGNTLYGNADSTHVNLGVACITGTSGQNYKYCTVGGGSGNTAAYGYATVGGGHLNTASDSYATVGGGANNTASYGYGTVGGGTLNTASEYYATVAGGYGNTASGNHAFVGGGRNNLAQGDYSAITGGYADTITSTADYSYLFGIGSKLTVDSTFMVDMPYIRFGDETNGYEFPTSDGSNGQVMATNGSGQLSWTTVSGAGDNDWAFRITDTADTTLITGGAWGIARYGNTLYGTADSTHVNLGVACTTGTSGQNYKYCTVGGGVLNTASDERATVGGGANNTASGDYASVGGGGYNTASGEYATVPGGRENTASGNHSFVAGRRAKANHNGTFVWADSTDADFSSTGDNQFLIRASGGVGIGTNNPQGALEVNSTTGAFIVPRMTTAQRDALTPVNGMIIYNTTTNEFNFYENGAWVTK